MGRITLILPGEKSVMNAELHARNYQLLMQAFNRIIMFDENNQGGALYAQTNSVITLSDYPDPVGIAGTAGLVLEDNSGAGMVFASTTSFLLASQGNMTLSVNNAGCQILVSSSGDIIVKLNTAGHNFTVQDSAHNPIFRVDEDGDLHGKTGKALTFDL